MLTTPNFIPSLLSLTTGLYTLKGICQQKGFVICDPENQFGKSLFLSGGACASRMLCAHSPIAETTEPLIYAHTTNHTHHHPKVYIYIYKYKRAERNFYNLQRFHSSLSFYFLARRSLAALFNSICFHKIQL
jgi:hypothetical protein